MNEQESRKLGTQVADLASDDDKRTMCVNPNSWRAALQSFGDDVALDVAINAMRMHAAMLLAKHDPNRQLWQHAICAEVHLATDGFWELGNMTDGEIDTDRWEDPYEISQSATTIEHIGSLTGWGRWADVYKVTDEYDETRYYFASLDARKPNDDE